MRNPGAHMAIAADGSFAGSLSGGCIESAVVAEALEVLAGGQNRITRFGEGSRYMDIRLPCGGGLDLLFQPLAGDSLARQCLEAIDRRQAFALELPLENGEPVFRDAFAATGDDGTRGLKIVGHQPVARLLIIGHGASVASTARLGRTMQMDVTVHSPDRDLGAELEIDGFEVHRLRTPEDTSQLHADPWTAVIFLFHDHEWEGRLMAHLLAQPHFYFGAMGGRRAHAIRLETLTGLGMTPEQLESIHAPIGLFHSTRDPDTLAISTLAEVSKHYHDDFCRVEV